MLNYAERAIPTTPMNRLPTFRLLCCCAAGLLLSSFLTAPVQAAQAGKVRPVVRPANARVVPAGKPRRVRATAPRFKDGARANFKVFDIDQGLSSGQLWRVCEMPSGDIWVGTNGAGVMRYDGTEFLHYTRSEGLANNRVRPILPDAEEGVWFGTDRGLSHFDGQSFYNYGEAEGLASLRISTLKWGADGELLIGCDGGFWTFDGQDFVQFQFEFADDLLLSPEVYDILPVDAGTYWVATKIGLLYISGEDVWHYDSRNGLPDDWVFQVVAAGDSCLLLGTRSGLSRMCGETFAEVPLEGHRGPKDCWRLVADHRGDTWIGWNGHGLGHLSGTVYTQYGKSAGLPNEYVGDIMEDRHGNIWVATLGGGLVKCEGRYIRHIREGPGLDDSNVLSLLEDKAGNIWFGTYDGGVSVLDGDGLRRLGPKADLYDPYVMKIVQDSAGDLWFSQYHSGVIRYNGGMIEHFTDQRDNCAQWAPHTCHKIMQHSYAPELYVDTDGALWMGTFKGAYRYADGQLDHYTDNVRACRARDLHRCHAGLHDRHVIAFCRDRDGRLWIGSYNGVISLRDTMFSRYDTVAGLREEAVRAILQDRHGDVWFGTFGGGVTRFDGTRFRTYTTADGLPHDMVLAMVEDRKGRLWLGTRRGICEVLRGPDGLHFRTYGKARGLVNTAVNYNAAIEDRHGRLWWGTAGGAACFDPHALTPDTVPPTIRLKAVRLFQVEQDWPALQRAGTCTMAGLDPQQGFPLGLELPTGSNHVDFDFTGIGKGDPGELRYSHRLLPLEADWSPPARAHSASYPGLAAGAYTFEVQSLNAVGVPSPVLRYAFVIHPPFWQTWWFYLCGLAVIGLGVALGFRWRTGALRARQRRLQQLVRAQTAELVDKNENLERANDRIQQALSEKVTMLREIHHRVKNNLQVISSLLDLQRGRVLAPEAAEALQEGIYRVKSIALIHQRLYQSESLAEIAFDAYLGELCQSLAATLAVPATDVELRIEAEGVVLPIDIAAPLGMIVNELVTNAYKYAFADRPTGSLTVQLAQAPEAGYVLRVADDGPGLPGGSLPDEPETLGLMLVRLLCRQLQGSLAYASEGGAVFTIRFSNTIDQPDLSHEQGESSDRRG